MSELIADVASALDSGFEYIHSRPSCPFSEPTAEWCPPLADNLGDSDGPPRAGHLGTPERVFQWLQGLWKYPVDASQAFTASDFTPNVLLTDSFATICGAENGSIYFRLIFFLFPNLSGPHLSYTTNDSQFIVNWQFLTTNGKRLIAVPVMDLFGFKGGLVNYRLSVFDVTTFISALLAAYGGTYHASFEGNLKERMWRWHVDPLFARAELEAVKLTGHPL